jgi:hypothetical protein
MTAAADSHLESGPDTPVVGPQLHHQVTLQPFTSSVVTFPCSSAFTARCNGRRCTDAGPQHALQPSFTLRRSGVSDEGASRITMELCACVRAMD